MQVEELERMIALRKSAFARLVDRNTLPRRIQQLLERGRSPSFHSDIILTDNADNPKHLRFLAPSLSTSLRSADVVQIDERIVRSSPDILVLLWDRLVEVMVDGRWVSGWAAVCKLRRDLPTRSRACDKIASLSWRAIKLASHSNISSVKGISEILYDYNRLPAAPSLTIGAGRLESAVMTANQAFVGAGWAHVYRSKSWLWWNRSAKAAHDRSAPYKLYISPHPSHTEAVLPVVARGTTVSRAISCKVASTPAELLRPDKICLYFETFTDVLDAMHWFQTSLAPVQAQGVPLSLSFGRMHMLSWGMDPMSGTSGRSVIQSWRESVCGILASALTRGETSLDALGADWKKTVFDVLAIGIDPFTWRYLVSASKEAAGYSFVPHFP